MVSIKDVARQAGVAISTVSKVLNNYPNVSVATKEKVNRAIAELGFVPNAIAAALSSKKSGRIALLINLNAQTQAIDEIGMQYMAGAIRQAKEYNLDLVTVFFSMIQDMTYEEITRYFLSQNIAGIIICGLSKDDYVLHELIQAERFKIVIVDAPIVNATTSSVWIDHKRAQYDIAKKTILENNAKRVLYIAGKKNGYVTDERLKGMNQLVQELKLTMLVRYGNFSELEARKLTFQYGQHKDIVVCASDLMAIGAMKALTEMDIFRPVCGFDGIMLMGYVGKQMNTVRQNFARISGEAVRELYSLMEENEGKNIVLDYEMVRMQYLDIIC
ncbi:MAG: LacI family DNA-binding transcriptional regulator [Lachnospiraceae bacterium]|nr:LacI family DNA-binding transcriptional regulator [Lachnospiraceae bacterium]